MKLNYRDRIVLTVVIVILVWVAGVMLFIKPSIERLQASQAALDDAKAKRSDLQDRVDADKDLPERIVEAYKEVTKMTESFYSVQETQVASQLVDDLLDSDEIVNLDMNISDYKIYALNPYAYRVNRPQSEIDADVEAYKNQVDPLTAADALDADSDVPAANGDEIVPAPATIGSFTITFNFEGSLENMEQFCEKLQTSNDQKTMVINALVYRFNVIKNDDEESTIDYENVSGNMELTMMVVEKLPDPNTLA